MKILDFLNDNYSEIIGLSFTKKYGIYILDAEGVELKPESTKLTNGLFRWGEVNDFDCSCSCITSLEGSPMSCDIFSCEQCNGLENLKGAPTECNRFYCSDCDNLTSLEGAPKICSFFNCSGCTKLESLEGMPLECDKINIENCESLKNLNGIHDDIGIIEFNFCNSLSREDLKNLQLHNKDYE